MPACIKPTAMRDFVDFIRMRVGEGRIRMRPQFTGSDLCASRGAVDRTVRALVHAEDMANIDDVGRMAGDEHASPLPHASKTLIERRLNSVRPGPGNPSREKAVRLLSAGGEMGEIPPFGKVVDASFADWRADHGR